MILKRLLYLILVTIYTPFLFIITPLEILYYILRWIFTGKEFADQPGCAEPYIYLYEKLFKS